MVSAFFTLNERQDKIYINKRQRQWPTAAAIVVLDPGPLANMSSKAPSHPLLPPEIGFTRRLGILVF